MLATMLTARIAAAGDDLPRARPRAASTRWADGRVKLYLSAGRSRCARARARAVRDGDYRPLEPRRASAPSTSSPSRAGRASDAAVAVVAAAAPRARGWAAALAARAPTPWWRHPVALADVAPPGAYRDCDHRAGASRSSRRRGARHPASGGASRSFRRAAAARGVAS